MRMMVKMFDNMSEEKQNNHIAVAKSFLMKLDKS